MPFAGTRETEQRQLNLVAHRGTGHTDGFDMQQVEVGCHQTADRVTVMMHDVWKSKA